MLTSKLLSFLTMVGLGAAGIAALVWIYLAITRRLPSPRPEQRPR